MTNSISNTLSELEAECSLEGLTIKTFLDDKDTTRYALYHGALKIYGCKAPYPLYAAIAGYKAAKLIYTQQNQNGGAA